MRPIHRSRVSLFGMAALAGVLVAPMVVEAQDQSLAMAPAAPAWDATSGYASVEASRATTALYLAPSAGTTWDATSGYRAVEANRLLAAQQAVLSGDLGSVQEHASAELIAAATWNETSGYDSLEASRAAATALIDSQSAR
jgi:hypothetical protein